ncbi:MAG: 16S rRNA (guanine(527)-N(7))-methyltransferase RsmG [Anaerolineae bacterium]|nr:16S rRNA (guanine(527)-N(7))-methyltransferase RsmG [Anaerolineae bacterium]MDW8099447.1 16S rRNA (guanine(527)-N(7))-methyltransferase RsmG [Anaerolineae bacterium]
MERLRQGARQMGIELTEEQLTCFRRFSDLLLEWNRRFNLTAMDSPEQVEVRHFLDSLSCLTVLSQLASEEGAPHLSTSPAAIDVGTGAGFPGLALKIAWPALRLTLLEATGKKVRFLEHVIAELGLRNVIAIHGRAEELAHQPEHRAVYDLALARAVASLSPLLELTLPFLRLHGWLLAWKGPAAAAEAMASERALAVLGGRLHCIFPVEVPYLAEERFIVAVQKAHPTPEQFPRRAGVPVRRPL